MSQSQVYLAFNRGTVSRLALARLDLKRLAMSAEIQSNMMPRALGSAMLRPGLGYLHNEGSKTKLLEFVFAADDTALVELHDEAMTIVVDDVRLTRPEVTSNVVNGSFSGSLAGWTQEDLGATYVSGGAQLIGNGTNIGAIRTVVVVDQPGIEHGVNIVIRQGVAIVRIGSTANGQEYITDTALGVGSHSIAFTPSGDFHLRFHNQSTVQAVVDGAELDYGDVILATPWGEEDFQYIRDYQSGDVIFVACRGHQQRRIVRTGNRSWSVELYAPNDGPFLIENITDTTLTASAITGEITLTASGTTSTGVFYPEHVGALFRLSSIGQTVTDTFTAQNQFTNSIRVTGVGSARTFYLSVTGTYSATLTLQFSVDDATWTDRATYAGDTSFADGLDNQIIYYRIGIKTGDYVSGTAIATLTYSSGSITGVARVTDYTSPTEVDAEVLIDLGSTEPTDVWAEGAWSDYRGWPTAVTILDGRLWWAGQDRFWGSVVDAYASFDPDYEGDAGPVSRSIGFGPVDTINWLLPMDRLMAGTAASELTCQSSAFDEPLTATNFTPKESSTQGSANIQALKVDDKVIFVQRCGTRVYDMEASSSSGKFIPEDLTAINPDACAPGIVYMAVQRQPDTRIHCALEDGTVGVLVFDKAENLICWIKVETDGVVEDVAILPGQVEDSVYYIVKREIDGDDEYHLEKWALESECQGGELNKLADSFVVYEGAATATIDGLDHLEGEEVIVWADGRDFSPGVEEDQVTYTVTGGEIELDEAVESAVVGLPYKALFKSTKLAYMAPPGKSALNARKNIMHLGLVLADVHPKGLEFGPNFETMDPMPEFEAYDEIDQDEVREAYEEQLIEFPGEWAIDARLCLRMTAPRPCTVIAAVIDLQTNIKSGT